MQLRARSLLGEIATLHHPVLGGLSNKSTQGMAHQICAGKMVWTRKHSRFRRKLFLLFTRCSAQHGEAVCTSAMTLCRKKEDFCRAQTALKCIQYSWGYWLTSLFKFLVLYIAAHHQNHCPSSCIVHSSVSTLRTMTGARSGWRSIGRICTQSLLMTMVCGLLCGLVPYLLPCITLSTLFFFHFCNHFCFLLSFYLCFLHRVWLSPSHPWWGYWLSAWWIG